MEKKDKSIENNNVVDYLLKEIDLYKNQLEKKEEKIKKLKCLSDVTTIISSSLNKNEILKRVLKQTKDLMNCKKSSILLVDPVENQLKFEVLTEETEMRQLQNIRLDIGEGIAGKVWETGKSVLIEDVKKDNRFSDKADKQINETTKSIIASPIVIKGDIIGVMEAINKLDKTNFDHFDLEIFEKLALHAAIAIENAELYRAGICDKMSNLYNHEFFIVQLEKELQRSNRYNHSLSIIIFDIDHFKKINDTYGHQFGDQVIIKIASLIKNSCRENIDLACRYGGEEFTLILPETEKENAIVLAERIRQKIKQLSIPFKGKDIELTVSAGVSSNDEDNPENRDEFIKMADSALYYSKNNGRDKVTYFSTDMLNRLS